MPTKVIMPQLGESVIEGTVSKWLKQEGEAIQEFESLLEINTDKVDSEIPSPAGGTLLKILVPEGETVRAGTIIAWIGQPGEPFPGDAPGAPQAHAAPAQRAPEVSDPGAGKSAAAIQESAGNPQVSQPVTDQTNQQPAADRQPAAREQPVMASAETTKLRDGRQMTSTSPVSVPPPGRNRDLGFISPIVARLAQEHQVDLTQVSGTGENGRITKKDVLAYVEQLQTSRPTGAQPQPASAVLEAWETPADGDLFRPTEMMFGGQRPGAQTQPVKVQPVEAAAQTQPNASAVQAARPAPVTLPGEEQIVPLNTMRRKIAEHMVNSKRTSPHVTTVMEADLQRMISHYNANKDAFARDGARLTYTAYFTAATVQALRAFPIVNSSWTDEGIQLHRQINLGLAVSLGEEGLIVPVLKGADGLSLLGMARAISDLASRARAHRLQPEDVRDGTFTITNHGISGSLFATPIINQPQCGILGVGAIQKRVVVLEDPAGGDTIAIRPMAYLSLTFDHRILDGASADGFLSKVIEVLENWQ